MRQFKKSGVAASVICYFLLLFFLLYSLNSVCFLSFVPIVPIKSYSNAEADKEKIIKENKDKSGIYRWENNINGKQYIGSAIDL